VVSRKKTRCRHKGYQVSEDARPTGGTRRAKFCRRNDYWKTNMFYA